MAGIPGCKNFQSYKYSFDLGSNAVVEYEGESLSVTVSLDVNRVIIKWSVNHKQYEDKKIGDHIMKATVDLSGSGK